jgi:predicted Zn-dependent peptidase
VEFFKDRYSLANAVAAVVGDIDIERTRALFEKYFGPVPARRTPPPIITREPEQMGERRAEVRFSAEPQVMIGFHKPSVPSRDDTVFDVIDIVLSSGRTSRLHASLVLRQKIASHVDTANGLPGARFPNLFFIQAVPFKGIGTERVEKAVYDELDRLIRDGVEPWEMDKAKKQLRADFLRSLDSNRELSHTLSYYQTACGDWRYLETNLAQIQSVTPEEVRAVAAKYFTARNRTVATLVKE